MTGKELRIKRYALEISAQETASTLGISSTTLLSIEDESKRVKDLVLWLTRLENYLAQCEKGTWQFETWTRIPADYFELMPEASKENISEMRKLRLSLNIKSCVFARNLGWDESAISNYENHAARMPLLRWQKAMKLLQSELDKRPAPAQIFAPCKTLTPEEEAAITGQTDAQQLTFSEPEPQQEQQATQKPLEWHEIIANHPEQLYELLMWLANRTAKINAKCPTREARSKLFHAIDVLIDNFEVSDNAED